MNDKMDPPPLPIILPTIERETMMRERLNPELESESRLIRRKSRIHNLNTSSLQLLPHLSNFLFKYKIFTIAIILCLFIIKGSQCHSSELLTPRSLDQTPINNKVFHHNRTSPAVLSINQKTQPVHDKNKKKKNPVPQAHRKTPTTTSSPPAVQPNLSINNVNNYFKTAINFLNMGLRGVGQQGPTYKKNSQIKHRPIPTSPIEPTTQTLHPLAVLKTEVSTATTEINTNSSSMEGRSNLEFEPLFESEYGKNDSNHVKNLVESNNFLDKFEDHWDDPLAQESIQSQSFISHGPPLSVVRPPFQFHQHKAQQNYQKYNGQFPAEGSYNVNYKNVNYWPTKLNSYYGGGVRHPHHHHPLPLPPPIGNYEYRRPNNVPNSFNQGILASHPTVTKTNTHYDGSHKQELRDDLEVASSEIDLNNKSTGIMDRVSLFYNNYTVLAWGIIAGVAALAAIGVLTALYFNNPPTEVVTARHELAIALADPKLKKFLESMFYSHTSSNNNRALQNSQNGARSRQRKKKEGWSRNETD